RGDEALVLRVVENRRVREPAHDAEGRVADRAQIGLADRLTQREERELSLETILLVRLQPLWRTRSPEDADHRIELSRLALDPRDVGGDVHGTERHEHLLDRLPTALHEGLDETVGLLVTGDVIETENGDPFVTELGRHIPAARRLLLVAAHRAAEDGRACALRGETVGRRLRDDHGDPPLVDVVPHSHGDGARYRSQDHVNPVRLGELSGLREPHVGLAFRVLHEQPYRTAGNLSAHLVLEVELDAFVDLAAVPGKRTRQRIEQADLDGLARPLGERGRGHDRHGRDDEHRERDRAPHGWNVSVTVWWPPLSSSASSR